MRNWVIDHGDFEFDYQKSVGPPYPGVLSAPPGVNFGHFPKVGVRYPIKVIIFGFIIKSLVHMQKFGVPGLIYTENETQKCQMVKFIFFVSFRSG